MGIKSELYGGFIVSKNILYGKPIKYSFREESSIQQLNGWNFYAIDEDEEYVSNPDNFIILSAKSMHNINPVILDIFSAPYGTDLCWLYENDIHVGFYDFNVEKEFSIIEMIKIINS
ncbi:DUF2185 domain-containing protein [Sebaldella sp. S0638]|uniref:DUF2185 domain-containing protein n=1 Tax=Sebaldella sp. S0638 TaxID=2957809 RepID=UPI00209C7D9D|nr:DUF2185 domain-containing protein [Sebaldella sp. S0638]MCP1224318.1 DUF2185 domain-containing protein [Sebaldella sp. S0638]